MSGFLTAVTVVPAAVYYPGRKSCSLPHLKTVESIQHFLDPGHAHFAHEYELRGRAVANYRLFQAFNIRSTFVSDDKVARDKFNQLCRSMISESLLGGWRNFEIIEKRCRTASYAGHYDAIRRLASQQQVSILQLSVFSELIPLLLG